MRQARLNLPDEMRKIASTNAQSLVLKHPRYVKAKKVALYRAFDGELPTRLIAEHTEANGKDLLFTRVCDERGLVCVRASEWTFRRNGLPEPFGEEVELDPGDLIVVPGVAFDLHGNRLGMGGGHYDRFLCRTSAWPLGLAYNAQVVRSLPQEPWDVPMRTLVTELMTYEFDEREKPQWRLFSELQSAL